jgi:aspartate aminotransferase-like enzyme
VRAGVRALGLNLWADEDAIRADTVTAIEMPSVVDEAEVPVIALTALGRALRRLGAKADIGAAVEAALCAGDDSGR